MASLGKVALVFGPHRTWDAPRNFPTGLGLIAAVLRQAGYDVHVIEVKAERLSREQVMGRLASFDPDVVGFGGLITTYGYAKWLIQAVKRWRPDLPVIVGGGLGSSVPELILTRTPADVAVIGEAEETILELVPALFGGEPLDRIAGIAFRNAEWVGSDSAFRIPHSAFTYTPPRTPIWDLDRLPFPAWDLFPMEEYLKHPVVGLGRDMDLISSRGCPHRCTYCFQVFGHCFRARSAENMVEEIRQLDRRYGLDFVSFQDDCFVVDKKRVYEFCHLLGRSGLRIKWSCCGRVNLVDLPLLREMRASGCVSVNFGIESGSQTILDRVKKGVRVEQAKRAVRQVRRAGMRCPTSFMLGSPGETRETALETVRFCQELQIPLSALMLTTPYPGTPLFEEVRAAGRIPDDLEAYVERLGDCVDFTINLTDMTDSELLGLRDEMLRAVQESVQTETPAERERFERALYGDHLYEKGQTQLARPEEQAHRAQHGFNETAAVSLKRAG
jgi:anaerobic magnesium-protoporphyrin IX monomethyl ester cyclase